MTPIRAIVHDRRIDVPAPTELPDGTEVLVELVPVVSGKLGLEESEWRDDPAALADWSAWLETIEPIHFAEPDSFDDEFRRYNIEAVRKQMFGHGG
jgi:hypothetical protein